jgi:hypothetical protein
MLIKLHCSVTCLETLQFRRKVHQLFSSECQAYIITPKPFIPSSWIGYLFPDLTWVSLLKRWLQKISCIIFILWMRKLIRKSLKITQVNTVSVLQYNLLLSGFHTDCSRIYRNIVPVMLSYQHDNRAVWPIDSMLVPGKKLCLGGRKQVVSVSGQGYLSMCIYHCLKFGRVSYQLLFFKLKGEVRSDTTEPHSCSDKRMHKSFSA